MSANPRPQVSLAAPLPDETLVRRSVAGDTGALEELLSRHRGTALGCAARIVGRDEAEDIVQDAFLLACRFIGSVQEPAKFERWLLAIVRFRAFRAVRKESPWKRGRVTLDDGVEASISLVAFSRRRPEEGDAELLEALSRMPPAYGEVLRYHFLHGLPHQAIADLGGVPLSTVKYRCSRGKELLRAALREMRSPSLPSRVETACGACPKKIHGGRCDRGPRIAVPPCDGDG